MARCQHANVEVEIAFSCTWFSAPYASALVQEFSSLAPDLLVYILMTRGANLVFQDAELFSVH